MSEIIPEHFVDWNEQMVQRYDPEIFHHHPRGVVRWVEKKRVSAVLRSLELRPQHRVLDVGCGAGNILEKLPGAAERHGVDLSDFMVKRARKRLGSGVTIIQGDAEQLPYPDASFDRVLATSLLSHVRKPELVVAELRRVAKPGARVVISVSQEDQIEKGLRWVKSLGLSGLFFGSTGTTDGQPQVYNTEYHLHHFSLKRLREVVGDKLQEANVINVPLVFPVHAIASYNR